MADAFTTVSEMTARNAQFHAERCTWYPQTALKTALFLPILNSLRSDKEGRNKLLEVAEIILGQKFEDEVFLMATSGRYEFKNKGIDLFIDALGELNRSDQQCNGR